MRILKDLDDIGNDAGHGSLGLWLPGVIEVGEDIYLSNQLHKKSTLAPYFGKRMGGYFGTTTKMLIHNKVCNTHNHITKASSGGHQAAVESSIIQFTNRGQARAAGIKIEEVWESTYDPDLIYFGSFYEYDHAYIYYYVYSKSRKEIIRSAVHNHGSGNGGNMAIIHEDETYLYGFSCGNHTNGASPSLFAVEKSSLQRHRKGFYNAYSYMSVLHTDDVGMYYWLSCGHHASYYPGTAILYIKWSEFATVTTTASFLRRSPTNSSQQNTSYPFLSQVDSNGNHTNNVIHTWYGHYATDGFRTHQAQVEVWMTPGTVYNSTLLGNNILRTYHAMINISDTLGPHQEGQDLIKFIRSNIPLKDHPTAFLPDTGGTTQNSLPMGNEGCPAIDMRFCNEFTSEPGLPAWNEFTPPIMTRGAGTSRYGGDQNYIYSYYNTTYFEDQNGDRGFLMLDCGGTSDLSYGSDGNQSTVIWIFEIVNHTSAIANASPNETDSLDMHLIQRIDVPYVYSNLYRPNYHTKTFIATQQGNYGSADIHYVYQWNESTKRFSVVSSITGNITAIGNTHEGDIYSIQPQRGYGHEVHAHSITIPDTVEVVAASDQYEYSGTPINSTVEISAYNYLSNRVAATVNLEIVGDGVVFTNGAATNGGRTLTVTTSTGSAVTENITISSSTFVKIRASIST